ncbi:MAG: hypothetical protein ACJA0U_003519 [Salibacteraceae bacterium]|jgi:hypothetical protein
MRILVFISIVFIGSTVHGQNTGLYGKKVSLDLSFTGNIPIINMLNGPMFKSKSGVLTEKMDLLDYGLRTGASYALSNNFAIGIEFDMEFMNINAPTSAYVPYPSGNSEFITIKHQALNTRTLIFMPRLEFTSNNGLLPIGLSHQIGFGFTRTKVLQKDYDRTLFISTDSNGDGPILDNFDEDFYNYTNKAFKGIVLMYTLNVRTPINKFMMITYGIRYNFNYGTELAFLSSDDGFYLSRVDAYIQSRSRRLLSVISLNLGMSFAL